MRDVTGDVRSIRRRARRAFAAIAAGVLAVTGITTIGALPAVAHEALQGTVAIEAYWHLSDGYDGIAVNVSGKHVDDAAELQIIVHREVGGDVIKTSKAGGSGITGFLAGGQVTAPIVIAAHTYDEADSGSWNAPVDPAWAWDTTPTGVTIKVLDAAGDTIAQGAQDISPYGGVTMADVMPKAPELEFAASYIDDPGYKGITVLLKATNAQTADEVRVTVDRASGGPVVKSSKATGTVPASI